MSKYQDYTPDTSKETPKGFSLYGMDFDCHTSLPFGVIADFADTFSGFGLMTEEDTEDADENLQVGASMLKQIVGAVDGLFRTAIVDESQYQAWVELQHDPKRVVKMSTLLNICLGLLDAYMTDEEGDDRPTGGRSSKRSGKKSRGAVSKAGASRAVSTYTRSEPTVA